MPVDKHRSWTPGLREANLLIYFVNLADNRGPDGADPDPTPNEFPRATSRHCGHLRWGSASVLIHSPELRRGMGLSENNVPALLIMSPEFK
jgi:hypothetical protein